MTVAPPPSPSTAHVTQIGTPTTQSPREKAFNIAVWTLFTALWVAFFAVLLVNQGTVGDLWHGIRDLPLFIQGVLWLLFLPLMAGLAIWDASWPALVRLILIAGIAGFNVYLFYPRKGGAK